MTLALTFEDLGLISSSLKTTAAHKRMLAADSGREVAPPERARWRQEAIEHSALIGKIQAFMDQMDELEVREVLR